MVSIQIILRGKVQAVYFRSSARRRARNLGICGYVKNMPDGTLEIRAEGEQVAIDRFIEWCSNGPLLARVQGMSVIECPADNFTDFSIQ